MAATGHRLAHAVLARQRLGAVELRARCRGRLTVPFGALVVAVFDAAAHYSADPREVANLATQAVGHLLSRARRPSVLLSEPATSLGWRSIPVMPMDCLAAAGCPRPGSGGAPARRRAATHPASARQA